MEFETLSSQRKLILITSVIGIISLFFPWKNFSIANNFSNAVGNTYDYSLNGFLAGGTGSAIALLICFLICLIIGYLGDQTKNLEKYRKNIVLISGICALIILLHISNVIFSEISKTKEHNGNSSIAYGFFISIIAVLTLCTSGFIFQNKSKL